MRNVDKRRSMFRAVIQSKNVLLHSIMCIISFSLAVYAYFLYEKYSELYTIIEILPFITICLGNLFMGFIILHSVITKVIRIKYTEKIKREFIQSSISDILFYGGWFIGINLFLSFIILQYELLIILKTWFSLIPSVELTMNTYMDILFIRIFMLITSGILYFFFSILNIHCDYSIYKNRLRLQQYEVYKRGFMDNDNDNENREVKKQI